MSGSLVLPGISVSEFGGDEDFYETPGWAVDLLLPKLPMDRPHRWSVLDPCVGRGAIIERLMALEPCCLAGVELHRGRFEECKSRVWYAAIVHDDFLTMDFRAEFPGLFHTPRLIVMNPPYTKPRPTIGLEFVEKCIELAMPDGIVAALLPCDFSTGVERTERIHSKYPSSYYPLKRRPQFGGEFSSGQRPFAWFLWDLAEPKSEWGVLW